MKNMKNMMTGALVVAMSAHAALADNIEASGGETVERTGEISCQSVGIGAGGGAVVFDAATVTASGTPYQTGGTTGRIAFLNGTHAEFAGRTFFAADENANTHALVQVIDSYLKPAGNADCNLGNNAAGSTCVFAITNATFYTSVDLKTGCSSEFLCSNATFTSTSSNAKFGSGTSTTAAGRIVLVDSAFTAQSFFIGNGNKYDALVSGGTFGVSTLFQSGWKEGGTSSGSPLSTIRFTNGAQASFGSAWIADYTNAKATLVVDSNAVVTVGSMYTGGGLVVGRYGDGTIEINEGGTFKAWSVSGATQGGTCTIKANGGTFFVRGWKPSGAHDAEIFQNVSAITVGEKGLTIDTDGWAVTITHDITGGPVTFTGGGTVTIADGVTIDDFDVAGGTKVVYAAEGTTETIAVTGPGVETRTTNIVFNGNDTRIFDIASGAGLTLSGRVGIGALEKRGGGILTLDNPKDKFIGGLTLTAGTLGFGADAPARVNAPFMIGNTTAKTLTVIKNDEDLAMNFPSGTLTGAFLKRGAGELVWERNTSWAQYNDLTGPDTVATLDPAAPLDFGDGTVLPTDNFVALSVVEGRFTIRGTSSGRNSFRSLGVPWAVGTPVASCAAQPELVFDHMSVQISGGLTVGAAINAGSPVVSPKLIVRDSSLDCTYSVGRYCGDVALRPFVIASNSTLVTSMMCLNGGTSGNSPIGNPNVRATHRYEAGTILRTGTRLEYQYPATATFDNSILEGSAEGTAATLYGHSGCRTNTTIFANRSTFRFAGSVDTPSSGIHITARQTFVFDDSTMNPCTTADFTYDVNTLHFNMYFVMRGKGLVFEPVAGQTITMAEPLHGDGGFVNRGAGTTVLADGVVQYTGVTCAEQGMIDFNGATVTNVTLAGEGAFVNGTLVTPKVLADGSAPQLDGVTLDGKVTVVFGDTAPAVGTTVDVARYSGSIANWKVRRNRDFGAILSKDGNVVKATVTAPSGFVITVK